MTCIVAIHNNSHDAECLPALPYDSLDGVPFLLHDDTFQRTTDVHTLFPKRAHSEACWFNFSDVQQLNAGSWFIEACVNIGMLIFDACFVFLRGHWTVL